MGQIKILGQIVKGHGVASGIGGDNRYPDGTLRQQLPYFQEQGLDLSAYYLATINLDIAPFQFEVGTPKLFFKNIHWSEHIPAENFLFFDVHAYVDEKIYEGLVYMPDPSTKIDHAQKASVLELILPKIEGISYGGQLYISVPATQIRFTHSSV